MDTPEGILLYSGGLDSLLAGAVLLEQKLKILGVHFILPFFPPDLDPSILKASQYADSLGLPVHHIRCGKDYMSIVENPPHGYGKNLNPCIDCKIFFLKKAGELMRGCGASFVATGEVVGQRPMSQMKHMLNHIEKEAGLKGCLLRPLSAGILKPTNAERNGLVNREKLFDISGRGRKRQMELAEIYGIKEYASPAGGCLFTDSNFTRRLRDLFVNNPDYEMLDVYLLTLGRHFRINNNLKIIVSRNEKENNELEKYQVNADFFMIPGFPGPSVFVKGAAGPDELTFIASVILKYGKADFNNSEIEITSKQGIKSIINVEKSADNEALKKLLI